MYRGLYSYEPAYLNSEVEEARDFEGYRFEEVVYDSVYSDDDPVRAHLFLPSPKKFARPFQAVIFFQGGTQLFKKTRQPILEHAQFILDSGRAVLAPIYYGMFQRNRGQLKSHYPLRTAAYSDAILNIARDFSRSIDYLKTRGDIDAERLGFYGYSMGAALAPVLLGAYPEQGIKAAILHCGGLLPFHSRPQVDQINFAPRIRAAVLMSNGGQDPALPVETAQKPLFDLLNLPGDRKKHSIHDGRHWVPQKILGREGTEWLDRHLGPVQRVTE